MKTPRQETPDQSKVQDIEQASDLANMAAQVTFHQQQAEQHAAKAKQLKEKIAAELGAFKTVDAGDYVIAYTAPKRTFDEVQFVKAYPPESNAHMYKQVPAAMVVDRDMIPPKLKQNFMVPGNGTGSVTIK